ncbi:hypothetical protein [Nocardioides iriomotensis]|uniref:PqqD family protein n=1 Tax=Nocardioides iriomotensis TaxID=715784 RepID=A0A4Q5J4W6_9ACTN|nr:hypothetical protein [Nocardioides iriomotensis]RYU13680.1 hypothetical protein ETU37_05415 [Nocardioides iriomotensis]
MLIDGRVLVLSPLATRLLALIGEGWTDVDGLAASLAAAVGPPTDGRSAEKATADLVRELAADGVVEVRDAEDRPNG